MSTDSPDGEGKPQPASGEAFGCLTLRIQSIRPQVPDGCVRGRAGAFVLGLLWQVHCRRELAKVDAGDPATDSEPKSLGAGVVHAVGAGAQLVGQASLKAGKAMTSSMTSSMTKMLLALASEVPTIDSMPDKPSCACLPVREGVGWRGAEHVNRRDRVSPCGLGLTDKWVLGGRWEAQSSPRPRARCTPTAL